MGMGAIQRIDDLASYGQRAGAYLLDAIIAGAIFLVPFLIGSLTAQTDPVTGGRELTGTGVMFILLAYVLAFAFGIWNWIIRQGSTGQTVGKKVVGTFVVREDSRQVLGAGGPFLRYLVSALLGFCGIGTIVDLLWPLWDDKRQTLHDKAVSSLVVTPPNLASEARGYRLRLTEARARSTRARCAQPSSR